MTKATHSRCGTKLTKQSGLWWCPTCNEQPVYVGLLDKPEKRPPVEHHLGGGMQRVKVGSDYDDDETDYELDDFSEGDE